MSKLWDMNLDDEADVVLRVVQQVHNILDDQFPTSKSQNKDRRFAKTAFSMHEDTVVDQKPTSAGASSAKVAPKSPQQAAKNPASDNLAPISTEPNSLSTSKIAQPFEHSQIKTRQASDRIMGGMSWWTRLLILFALGLGAGLLFAYFVFRQFQ